VTYWWLIQQFCVFFACCFERFFLPDSIMIAAQKIARMPLFFGRPVNLMAARQSKSLATNPVATENASALEDFKPAAE
jgi:hypothetical protein